MLRSWYQPVRGSVWSEHKVFERLKNLSLVPEQQSSVDSGVRVDQWALSNSRSQQPFNAMCKRLIYSINANHQASTILMANGDFIADHHLEIEQATATAAQGAFLPVRERDLFSIGSAELSDTGVGSILSRPPLPRAQCRGSGPGVHHGG